jgi:hypothetical protein
LSNLLEQLCATGVEFILVGGLAAVSQGAPFATFDIDVVPSNETSNLSKLVDFLGSVHARFRGRPAGQTLRPALGDLSAGGHCLLMTDLGPLDVLGSIEQGLGYEALLRDAAEIRFRGYLLRVLKLEAIARMKRASTRSKDKRNLALIEETLRRSKQKS